MIWQKLRVAATCTHHVDDFDRPAYAARFDDVLKFHAPGLAPVTKSGAAWHIHEDGSPAYDTRFLRTFGYYEGLAAVESAEGWLHIDAEGRAAYDARHAWCGNFQGGICTVRDVDGLYRHIRLNGEPRYYERWRYAGDFRDGVAVVQRDDGQSTHIDGSGGRCHGQWFLDLDVFHKGFARARDDLGWMHVDRRGQPVYARRFAAVEPFYNGQARVERSDGGLEVIDERGVTLVELRTARQSAFAALSDELVGYWRTDAIATAVVLRVFEELPGFYGAVADRCGLPHPSMLRLLRALGELGLVETYAEGWRATEKGAYLRHDHPLTLADAALEYAGPLGRAWNALPSALRGDGAWRKPTVFADVAADPERLPAHHRMLRSYARHDYGVVAAALDIPPGSHVVDAGGGSGTLTRLILDADPEVRATVLDLSEVVAAYEPDSDAANLAWIGADILEPWPVRADDVVFARVLHDWDAERALAILKQARAALTPGGRVHIVEMLLDESSFAGGLCDLHLLAATGGRERTEWEYIALLREAGFEYTSTRRVNALPSIVTGVAR